MRNLFAFIYHYRGFLTFLLLEIICSYLIVQNNSYQSAAFYNSANMYAGQVLEFQKQVSDYFRLVEVNRALVNENRALQESITNIITSGRLDSISPVPDSAYRVKPDSLMLVRQQLDTIGIPRNFSFIPGKVINNSVRRVNNYLTLNVGRADGVEPGMGVVAGSGVVGRVKATSEHFATVTSLLHSQMLVSAKITRNNAIGSVKWDGDNYLMAALNFVPRHIQIQRGDTVVTSGYNAIFPEGVRIGRITSFATEADKSFYSIRLRLAVDFNGLDYVYVVKNAQRVERDSLEVKSGITEEND